MTAQSEASPIDLRFRFSRTLAVTQKRWTVYLDKRMKELGLSTTRWHALVELAQAEEPLSQNELALRVGIEKTSLVKLLDSLEEKGLIRRAPDLVDRRVKRVELLPPATDVLREISSLAAEVRAELLVGIPEADLRTSLDVLDMISANISAR
jgi:MarR family transcriptional regulator, transcriptional regulator for hemolysin